MSLSWVRAGTPVFYNRSSANELLATILGPSQHPSDYVCMQNEVNGKAVIHDAAALHRLKFHIRSPSPSPSTVAALSGVLFNPKYAGNVYKVTVAIDFLGNILWVCPLSPRTTLDVLIWDKEGQAGGSNVAVCCRSVEVQLGGES